MVWQLQLAPQSQDNRISDLQIPWTFPSFIQSSLEFDNSSDFWFNIEIAFQFSTQIGKVKSTDKERGNISNNSMPKSISWLELWQSKHEAKVCLVAKVPPHITVFIKTFWCMDKTEEVWKGLSEKAKWELHIFRLLTICNILNPELGSWLNMFPYICKLEYTWFYMYIPLHTWLLCSLISM